MSTSVKLISRGIAAVNKKRGDNTIMVYPFDILSEIEGEMGDSVQEIEAKGIDNENTPFTVKIQRGAVIRNVMWIGAEGRATAPDVRRGERVNLYQIGDDDRYYWESAGLDWRLRRLETVVFTWSGNPDNNVPNDESNTYYFEVNTHDKHATFRTTRANGELAAFTAQFNGATGTFTVEDDQGQHIHVDSLARLLQFVNGDNTLVELSKDTINLKANILNIDVNQANINSKTTVWKNVNDWDVGTGNAKIDASGVTNVYAGGEMTFRGSVIKSN